MPETKKPTAIQKAHDMVAALCDGRRDWIMSIPARPDSDPDLVIGAALSVADDMHDALEGLLNGECFCSESARVRDYDGNHSPACIAATAALAKARGEAQP